MNRQNKELSVFQGSRRGMRGGAVSGQSGKKLSQNRAMKWSPPNLFPVMLFFICFACMLHTILKNLLSPILKREFPPKVGRYCVHAAKRTFEQSCPRCRFPRWCCPRCCYRCVQAAKHTFEQRIRLRTSTLCSVHSYSLKWWLGIKLTQWLTQYILC